MNKIIPIEGDRQSKRHQEKVDQNASVEVLTKAVSAWFVRRDSKFYAVDRLNVKLSKDDVERACVARFADEFPDKDRGAEVLKEAFSRAMVRKHSVKDQSMPTWNGEVRCEPSVPGKFVWENGMVSINSWPKPKYRNQMAAKPEMGLAGVFFDTVFQRAHDRGMFLDWLAWCLQN